MPYVQHHAHTHTLETTPVHLQIKQSVRRKRFRIADTVSLSEIPNSIIEFRIYSSAPNHLFLFPSIFVRQTITTVAATSKQKKIKQKKEKAKASQSHSHRIPIG